jgi:hypothetical protein
VYKNKLWIQRALARARSLKGEPRSPEEQAFFEEHGPDDYFYVYGLRPEKQGYINYTIQFLEELDPNDLGMQCVAEARLEWSIKKLKGVKE